MTEKYTIWTLNRASELVENNRNDIENIFSSRGLFDSDSKSISVDFGDISTFYQEDIEPKYPHQLMFDNDKCPFEEYFVPIALKCIGQRYTMPDNQKLSEIVSQYNFFSTPKNFQSYWQGHKDDNVIKEVKMVTEKFRGYYDILSEWSAVHGTKNILIGYSQGGLVALYLAYLDAHVFKENIIKGVISMGTPVYGSPVANPDNIGEIERELVAMFQTLISLFPDKFRFLKGVLTNVMTIKQIVGILEAIIFDTAITDFNYIELRKTCITARKWLTGLLPSEFETAFHDLNINDFKFPNSVLSLINNEGIGDILYGSVINGNNNLKDFIKCFLSFIGLIGFEIASYFIHIFGTRLGKNIDESNKIYNEQVLIETNLAIGLPDNIFALLNSYPMGLTDSGKELLPKFAHDFVIPSVCQMPPMYPKKNSGYLGYRINLEAGHATGASQDNYGNLKSMLKSLKERL
jgi:hypothetical protein